MSRTAQGDPGLVQSEREGRKMRYYELTVRDDRGQLLIAAKGNVPVEEMLPTLKPWLMPARVVIAERRSLDGALEARWCGAVQDLLRVPAALVV